MGFLFWIIVFMNLGEWIRYKVYKKSRPQKVVLIVFNILFISWFLIIGLFYS
jgi:hypothetical protein